MRSLSGPVIAALESEVGERVYLIEITFSGGVQRLCTGSHDLSWSSQTWEATGGAISIGAIEEVGETAGGALELTLSGVDQAITTILLAQNFRGRAVAVYQALLNQTTGAVIDAITLFEGLQLDNYEVEEKVGREFSTCTIKTRAMHRLAVAEFRGIRTNPHGHQKYFTGDTFFQHVATFTNRKIYWGTAAPTVYTRPFTPGDPEDFSRGTGGRGRYPTRPGLHR